MTFARHAIIARSVPYTIRANSSALFPFSAAIFPVKATMANCKNYVVWRDTLSEHLEMKFLKIIEKYKWRVIGYGMWGAS